MKRRNKKPFRGGHTWKDRGRRKKRWGGTYRPGDLTPHRCASCHRNFDAPHSQPPDGVHEVDGVEVPWFVCPPCRKHLRRFHQQTEGWIGGGI